jgi:hypothetical protein
MGHTGNEINVKVVSDEFNLQSVPTNATTSTKSTENRVEYSVGRDEVGSGSAQCVAFEPRVAAGGERTPPQQGVHETVVTM